MRSSIWREPIAFHTGPKANGRSSSVCRTGSSDFSTSAAATADWPSLVRAAHPDAQFVAVDFSPPMLERLRDRFASDPAVSILDHSLDDPLPDVGLFDAVVSSFAIHHVSHARKRALYAEVFERLVPGGVFCNLEHVSSPTPALHQRFLDALNIAPEDEDTSNQLLDVETQLSWLRQIGFTDVDCLWKWRELALLVGTRRTPTVNGSPRTELEHEPSTENPEV